MRVIHTECDACKKVYDNIGGQYHLFARLTQVDGLEREICESCVSRLFGGVGKG